MSDLRWDLLTNASANLANSITTAAGQIAQRGAQRRDREAVTNYLNSPDDHNAFTALAERNPRAAFQLQDEHRQRIAALDTQRQNDLRVGARLLANVRDEAGYQRALAAAQQGGIDIEGAPPTYDPNWVEQVRVLGSALDPEEASRPVTLGENQRLVDPNTGREIARGVTRRRFHAIPPGGRLAEEPEDGPAEMIATNPETGESVRYNPQTGQWEPIEGGPQASNPAGGFPW